MFKSFAFKIYLAALVFRLIPVIAARGLGIGLDDMFQYDMLARSLAQGHGFRWYAESDLNQLASFVDFDLSTAREYDPILGVRTSFRAPLYPIFLAIVYFFNGIDPSRFFAARLAQAIFLGAPLAPLTYFVTKKLFLLSFPLEMKDEREDVRKSGKDFRVTVAHYPSSRLPHSDSEPKILLRSLLASFLFLLSSLNKPTNSNFLLSGIFLALTALTRSVILAFAFAAFCLLFYLHGKRAILSITRFCYRRCSVDHP
ncbi:MAG: hypothetical protein U0X87_02625 [Anaerolineales bacterium]